MTTSTKAILIDITRCVGCRACEQTCKQIHNFPTDPEPQLSATAFTVVQERADRNIRRLCMHCQDPTCVSVCLVGALQKTPEGPVIYDPDRCMGCRYCLQACPFQVPSYEWTRLAPFVRKCDMCADRIARDEMPACVEACPVQAAVFGTRDEMLAEARRRIAENPSYVKHIYGEKEAGGTSVLMISDVPFEKLGFFAPPLEAMPTLTAGPLHETPTVVLVGSSLLAALYWITQRRQEVAAAETGNGAPPPLDAGSPTKDPSSAPGGLRTGRS
jgi:formate dehydrogenase iron-sulfur subunit